MSDQTQVERTQVNPPLEMQDAKAAEVSTSAGMKGWLKGGLGMAVCCAAPLLLIAAIAFFGLSLGALASGLLSVAILLACPVGMFIMMRMMMKDRK
jgi:hypothetical protein